MQSFQFNLSLGQGNTSWMKMGWSYVHMNLKGKQTTREPIKPRNHSDTKMHKGFIDVWCKEEMETWYVEWEEEEEEEDDGICCIPSGFRRAWTSAYSSTTTWGHLHHSAASSSPSPSQFRSRASKSSAFLRQDHPPNPPTATNFKNIIITIQIQTIKQHKLVSDQQKLSQYTKVQY